MPKFGTCTYCGERGPVTRDHVPPRSVFPDPKPEHVVTVPACPECNEAFKLDDEHFRTFIVTRAYTDPAAQELWNRKIIGSPGAAGIRGLLRRSMKPVELKSPAGLYLGRASAVALRADRVARVVGRIALGLLWHHENLRPADEVSIHAGMVRDFSGMEQFIAACRRQEIGNGVFRYAFGVPPEDRDQSLWFFEFYSSVRFVVYVTRKNPDAYWLVHVPPASLMRTLNE